MTIFIELVSVSHRRKKETAMWSTYMLMDVFLFLFFLSEQGDGGFSGTVGRHDSTS